MLRALPDPLIKHGRSRELDEASADKLACLMALERKVLWLSTWMIHHANHIRPSRDGLKVGGHQASSSSVATLMTADLEPVPARPDVIGVVDHQGREPQDLAFECHQAGELVRRGLFQLATAPMLNQRVGQCPQHG